MRKQRKRKTWNLKRLTSFCMAVCIMTLSFTQTALAAGWQQNSTGWWWADDDGSYPANSWRKVDGNWHYFDSNGYWVKNGNEYASSKKGIDVSKYQGNINWPAVKADGIDFAFVRAGHGSNTLDPYFKRNMSGANAAGVPVGVYFYSKATSTAESAQNAKFVIEQLKGYTVSYPVAIDVEDAVQAALSKQQVSSIINAFCNEVKAAGYYPIVYCNENWYKNYIDIGMISGIDKWVAAYRGSYNTSIPRNIWQCSSKGRVNGIGGNVDINFGFTDYTAIITPRTYPVEGYAGATGTWIKDSKGWWYQRYGGGYPVNAWEYINGSWFHFDSRGYMQTGWTAVNGIWYYLNESGVMLTGWIHLGGRWYYLAGNGAMLSGWLNIGNQWYYCDSSGVMQTGWTAVNGIWYYMNPNGIMLTGWIHLGNRWYYLAGNGAMLSGWLYIGDKWYYCDPSGAMQIGWARVGNNWYYLGADGAMLTGWINLGGTWYYLAGNGAMLSGWINLEDKWYYCNSSGAMQLGWAWIGNSWYYLGPGGVMHTGWIQLGGTWYYMAGNGMMMTDWIQLGDTWYYLDKNGAWTGQTA